MVQPAKMPTQMAVAMPIFSGKKRPKGTKNIGAGPHTHTLCGRGLRMVQLANRFSIFDNHFVRSTKWKEPRNHVHCVFFQKIVP